MWWPPGAGRGPDHGRGANQGQAVVVSVSNLMSSIFLNRGRGYHHTLAVVVSVCVVVVHMSSVLIPYAMFRIKDDLVL